MLLLSEMPDSGVPIKRIPLLFNLLPHAEQHVFLGAAPGEQWEQMERFNSLVRASMAETALGLSVWQSDVVDTQQFQVVIPRPRLSALQRGPTSSTIARGLAHAIVPRTILCADLLGLSA
jgi:hypothetical protein